MCRGNMKRLESTVCLTSGYQTQANGQIDNINQEVGHSLRNYCANNQSDWVNVLSPFPWKPFLTGVLASMNGSTEVNRYGNNLKVLQKHVKIFPTMSEAPSYNPRDRVWLSTRDKRGIPGCITKQFNPVSYQLELPTQCKINPRYYVSHLKPLILCLLDKEIAPAVPS